MALSNGDPESAINEHLVGKAGDYAVPVSPDDHVSQRVREGVRLVPAINGRRPDATNHDELSACLYGNGAIGVDQSPEYDSGDPAGAAAAC